MIELFEIKEKTTTNSGLLSNTSSFGCVPNPCVNNGICFEKDKTFTCFCPPGYVGNLCEFSYSVESNICTQRSPCKNGKCIPLSDGYNCVCDRNWVGKNCDAPNPCLSSPCMNKGLCLPSQLNEYICSCINGFKGKQ